MVAKTFLQTVVLVLIERLPSGTIIRLPEFYETVKGFLLGGAPPKGSKVLAAVRGVALSEVLAAVRGPLQVCAARGDLPSEPRYKNDVRWAIRFAKERGLLKHVGAERSGEWQRTRISGEEKC
jgi:hypothetical protein